MSVPLSPPVASSPPIDADGPGPKLAIIERIRRDIKATLAYVTTGNGWHITLTASDRNPKSEPSPANGLAIIYQGEPTPSETEDEQSHEWEVDFGIKFYIVQSESDATAIDTAVNNTRGDIERALCQDATKQRSGLALNTTPSGFLTFEHVEGEFAGGIVFVTVKYSTNFGDPFTSAFGTV